MQHQQRQMYMHILQKRYSTCLMSLKSTGIKDIKTFTILYSGSATSATAYTRFQLTFHCNIFRTLLRSSEIRCESSKVHFRIR